MSKTDGLSIVITGANGQLGFYCKTRLSYHYGHTVTGLDRAAFNDDAALAAALDAADVIVHLAGVNRGDPDDVTAQNLAICDRFTTFLRDAKSKPHVINSSSIQVDLDNPYGAVKREMADTIAAACASHGSVFSNLILPNLFGEFSRPFYNNFIGTFCSQIASGEALTIHNDSPVTLMHYIEVADLIAGLINSAPTSGDVRPKGHETSVKTVADKLSAFYETYKTGQVPDLRDDFDLHLFNTLRSYIFEPLFPIALTRHADARGSFFECIRAENPGQTSFSTTVPGITRGDHFHFNMVERFLVLSGNAKISIRRLTDNKIYEFDVSGDKPCVIDMPTLHTHKITNTGDTELLTLFWSHKFFNPTDPDTYAEAV